MWGWFMKIFLQPISEVEAFCIENMVFWNDRVFHVIVDVDNHLDGMITQNSIGVDGSIIQ